MLDVGAHPHLLGGADKHADGTGPALGEDLRLLPVVSRLVDEPHRGGGHPTFHQLGTQLVVGVPLLPWGTEIAEHELEGTEALSHGGIGALVGGIPDPDDAVSCCGRLPPVDRKSTRLNSSHLGISY